MAEVHELMDICMAAEAADLEDAEPTEMGISYLIGVNNNAHLP